MKELPLNPATFLRRWRMPIIAATFALGALMYAVAPTQASPGTSVTVAGGSANPGGSMGTAVAATLAAGDTLNGFDITLGFSPSVATVSSVTLAGNWAQLGGITTTINNASGTVRVQGIQFNAGCTTSSCPLFTVNWVAVAPGSTQVAVAAQTLSGTNGGSPGQITSVSTAPGTLSVNGAAPTATRTSAPATATSVPPTNTSVSAPSTAVPATNTPTAPTAVPSQASTQVPNTRTPVPQAPTSGPAPVEPTATPTTAAPTSAPTTPGPSPAAEAPVELEPTVGAVIVTVPTQTLPPRTSPLPPNTGDGLDQASSQSLARVGGLSLMAIAAMLAALSLIERVARRRPADPMSGLRRDVARYLDDASRRGGKLDQ